MLKGTHRKRVLVISRNDPSRDPRPRRCIELYLSLGFEVDLLTGIPSGEFAGGKPECVSEGNSLVPRKCRVLIGGFLMSIPLGDTLWLKVLNWLHGLRVHPRIKNRTWDLVSVHDLECLPDALEMAHGCPVFFDARELYTKQDAQNWLFKLFIFRYRSKICREYLKQCSQVFTISEGFKRVYYQEFNVKSIVLRSVPRFVELEPRVVSEKSIRLVHHGVANANRSLDALIEMTGLLDDSFTLDLYLTGDESSLNALRRLAKAYPKVTILPPIKFEDIVSTLNEYDLGIIFYPPLNDNLEMCLPNKFFEFVQARIGVVTGPSSEMMSFINKYSIGLVIKDFSFVRLAETLNQLSIHTINNVKQNTRAVAQDLCFEHEKVKMIEALYANNVLQRQYED
ncbi:MAG: hypothetical protein ACPGN3_04895 [Opitutales bacterium]